MTVALPATAFSVARPWRASLAALCGVMLALLMLFRADARTLAHLWWTSTTFGHCLFIGPVVGWLIWIRRHDLARLTPLAWAPGLFLVAAGGGMWLVGAAAGVALARQLGLVTIGQGAVVTLLGPRVARGIAFPLAFAWFLVPFGESIEGPLQRITVAIVMPLLHLFGVPAQLHGVLITIPHGYFEVAEACSGDKFVLAMLPFGVLVSATCLTRWTRRAAFLAASLIVPVLANGVRAFATIYAAHLTSVEQATGFDHIVYGWLFFALVIAATLALGWRWFDRAPDTPAFDPGRLAGPVRWPLPLPLAVVLTLAVALAFPAWSAAMADRAQTLPASVALPEVPGWHRILLSERAPWMPNYPGADRFLYGRYGNAAGDRVDLAIALFAGQGEGKSMVGFGRGVLREEDRWVRVGDEAPIAGGAVVRITTAGPVERLVATWYRVGTVTTASPAIVKLETLRVHLTGGPTRAGALHLSAVAEPGHDPRAAIARFRAALGEPGAVIDRLTR